MDILCGIKLAWVWVLLGTGYNSVTNVLSSHNLHWHFPNPFYLSSNFPATTHFHRIFLCECFPQTLVRSFSVSFPTALYAFIVNYGGHPPQEGQQAQTLVLNQENKVRPGKGSSGNILTWMIFCFFLKELLEI